MVDPVLAEAQIDEVSLCPGEVFSLRLTFNAPSPELQAASNVSVDTFRLEPRRDELYGFGTRVVVDGAVVTATQRLLPSVTPGVYVVRSATLCWPEGQQQRLPLPAPIHFQVRAPGEAAMGEAALKAEASRIGEERRLYLEQEIITDGARTSSSTKHFRVLVFGVGCLVHNRQPLGGFAILPIEKGFSFGSMLSAVNHGLWKVGIKQLSPHPELEQEHQRATPTFLVDYFRVRAMDHVDALEHCRVHADLVFDLLGLDREQKPREFFRFAIDLVSGEGWFRGAFSGYKGNIAPSFDPTAAAQLIESAAPKLQRDPFLRLLVRSHAEATAERDPGIALLRAWTVLELLAERAIPRGLQLTHLEDGLPILQQDGKAQTTGGAAANVYEFLKRTGTGFPHHFSGTLTNPAAYLVIGRGADSNDPAGTRYIPLWDVIRAAYAIRNSVAHEGYFSEDAIDVSKAGQVIAADLIKNTPLDPRGWIRSQSSLAVRRELKKP